MKRRLFNSYNRKLFAYFFVVFALFSSAIGIFQYQREQKGRIQKLESVLFVYNHTVYNFYCSHPDSVHSTGAILHYFPDSNLRITIIDLDGTVIYDSFVKNFGQMENHIDRPEIVEATQSGVYGSEIRSSSSTGREYYYYARKYPNVFIRTALPYDKGVVMLLRADFVFVLFVLVLFFVSAISLIYVSDRMGKSISQLEDFARRAGNNETVDMQIKFPDNDLGAIGNQIVAIYKSLKKTQNALSYEKEKLIKHLHISQEGLATFSKHKKEILANSHFIQYANMIADQQIVWSDEVFSLKEFEPINQFVDFELSKDKKMLSGFIRQEMNISKGGHFFQVQCIVFQDKTFEISINDITLIEREKILKRELTSNIAHELKTPVSSIKGYLETILNAPNLDAEKQKLFIERSYSQTLRLAELITDLSLLNKIEEAGKFFDREDLDVQELVENIFSDLHQNLEEKRISHLVKFPLKVVLHANRSLVYSVFRNLIDNAIAYAGEDITIGVNCYREDDTFYYFSLYDTGVGVSEEHHARIFERFYRVDSGRSRKMGGTGLGLSIVKNAITLHGGTISVKNRAEGGLEFLFSLRKSTNS